MKNLGSLHAERAAILYNPVARAVSRHQHLLQRTIGVLSRQGVEAKLVPTLAPGSATAQVRQLIADGADLILAAGGDGTVNEVANGMLHTNVPMAILPGGTANVLGRELGLPMNMERAARLLPQMQTRRIAAGALRFSTDKPRAFVCMAGVGLDAHIVSRLNLDLKAAAGKLAYYIGGFSQVLRTLPEFSVTVDGVAHQASFALISRVRNYGGDLEIARGASLLCNDFQIVLFRGRLAMQYIPYLLGVAMKRVHHLPGCTVLRGHNVRCQTSSGEPVYVQVDGELAGALPLTTEILPDAITLLVPPRYLAREQALAQSIPVCA